MLVLFQVVVLVARVRRAREERARRRKRSLSHGRSSGPRTDGEQLPAWAAEISTPSYDADMLFQWRVVAWAFQYAAKSVGRRVVSALGLQGMDDLLREEGELDEHAAYLQKRSTGLSLKDGGNVPSRLRSLVGNTPMLAITFRFMGKKRVIYAKAEQYNMTGSVKDRMALHILEKAYTAGKIKPGDLIVEASSGNSGISFAAMGRALGHPVAIYMPDWMSAERKALLRGFGAQLVQVSALQGGFVGSIRLAQAAKSKHRRVFLPEQFSNEDNAEAHEASTGPEILMQLASVGKTPAAFIAGVGTGGTIMGVSRAFRSLPELKDKVKLHPMEPAESPTLSRGRHLGHHRIQGISDEFVPPVLSLPDLDDIIPVPDGDAIRMAQKLSRDLGLGVGISSGANFLAALEAQERLGPEAVVVTILCDDNKKYLTSSLSGAEPLKPGYRAQHVELLSFEVVPALPAAAMARVRDGSWHSAWREAATTSPARLKSRFKAQKRGIDAKEPPSAAGPGAGRGVAGSERGGGGAAGGRPGTCTKKLFHDV